MITQVTEDGRVLGDKFACGLIAGTSGETFATYQRDKSGKHKNNPVPQPTARDLATGVLLTDLEKVREWAAKRPRGPGVGGRPKKESA